MRNIRKKIKFAATLLLLVCLAVAFTFHIRKNVAPVVLAFAESTIQSQAVNAVNSAAHIIIAEDMDYSELVRIIYDDAGNIQLIQPDSVKLNRLARDLQNLSQSNVELISEQFVYIPIGAFSGSVLLSGIGPSVAVKMMPIGSVVSSYFTVFENVGINQTRHSIYINVQADISLVLPIYSDPVSTVVSVLVCDCVIMGKIPDVYVNGEDAVNYLDLID